MELVLTPVEATEDRMRDLELRGVLRRLLPERDRLPTARGESCWKEVYAAAERFGPHKLIAVTINRTQPEAFAWHSDAEDFLLLPHGGEAGLILTVCLHPAEAAKKKAEAGHLSEADFMALHFSGGDPQTSFFTMNPGYPHVETCTVTSDRPPCFYVTESRQLDENPADFGPYGIRIQEYQTTGGRT